MFPSLGRGPGRLCSVYHKLESAITLSTRWFTDSMQVNLVVHKDLGEVLYAEPRYNWRCR